MKRVLITLLCALIALSIYSQEEQNLSNRAERKLAREQLKLEERLKADSLAMLIDSLINIRCFAIEVLYHNERGRSAKVDPENVFIIVEASNIYIRMGAIEVEPYGLAYVSGSSITSTNLEANRFEVSKDGKNKVSYNIMIDAESIWNERYHLILAISSNGDASATLEKIPEIRQILRGNFVPISKITF